MFGRNERKGTVGCKAGAMVPLMKHLNEVSVGRKAVQRAGRCVNLNGHVAEQLVCDRFNRNPVNILTGKVARQTKSPIAVRDDILVFQKGHIIGRKQIKDTPAGIAKTLKQVKAGHYKGTRLEGTVETVKKYYAKAAKSKTPITQKMSSIGISSDQTNLIKAKTLGGSLVKNGPALAREARRTGLKAGAVSGAVSTVVNGVKVYKGEETLGQATKNVTKSSVVGTVSGAAGNAAGSAATILVATTPAAPTAPLVGGAVGTGAAFVAAKVTDMAWESGEKVIARTMPADKGFVQFS